MKGNAKRLSVLVGVSVITLVMVVVTASAGPAIPYGIKGEYKVTGYSSCDPTNPGIIEADYIFKNDGTGSFKGTGHNIDSYSTLQCSFTYTVKKDGAIEFQYPFPPGGINAEFFAVDGTPLFGFTTNVGPSHGFISPDGKTLTIICGPPYSLHVIDPETGERLSPDMYCITSLAGMRIN